MKQGFFLSIVCGGLVAVALTGCVRYHPKPVVAAQTLAAFEVRSLDDTGLRRFLEAGSGGPAEVWSLPSWSVTNLTFAAFYFHPDLDVARARWAVARAGTRTAGERQNPTVGVTPGRNTTTLTPSPWLLATTLDIPVETAGKRGYRLAQANSLSEAARLNLASAAWQVRSRLHARLLDFYATRETEELMRQQQTVQAEIVKLMEAQMSAGAASTFEVTQARIAFDSVQLAQRDAERQSADARVQLAAAIGLSASALDGVNLSFASFTLPPPELPPTEIRRQALLNRPDILGALAEYAASESALRLQVAKQYPDVHFNPGYDFDQGDNKWSLGLSVTLPVLNQNRGAIAEAEAKRGEAAASFTALQARVLGDLDRALVAYRSSASKTATAEALLVKLKKQEQTTQAMLSAGELPRLALLNARLELGTVSLAQLNALVQAQQALGQLEDVLQSPVGLAESLWLTSPRSNAPAKDMKHE